MISKGIVLVGVDTGGTFTDFVYKIGKAWRTLKILSTPKNPAQAVLKGLEAIAKREKRAIVHGSTIATNAILERKGAKTALVTNEGFEDIVEIGCQNRDRLYCLTYSPRPPLVPKGLRFGIKGRILQDGGVYEELDDNEIYELAHLLRERDIESIAVSLLFSFKNPSHENRVGKILEETRFPISLSHKVLPEFREYERMSTTVINAYVSPLMKKYVSHLKACLGPEDLLRIMQSNGGSISSDRAMTESVRTILSGPAGGTVGGMEVAKVAGFEKVITFDMGGTSTDVSLIDGKLRLTTEGAIDRFPVKVPMIEIHTVGAGGGSIAYIDEGGALRVGPRSAGADPGPICYGKGREITVTDANLFLRRLIPEYFLGGRMRLKVERLEAYFKHMASNLKLSELELSEGIISVVNSSMERAIRVISVERGHDPREFVLVAFGGAGGMHAAYLARLLSIPRVLIPENPGTLSALGMLMADVIKDYSHTVMLKAHRTSVEELRALFSPLEEQALNEMDEEGIGRGSVVMEHLLDVRYVGQSYELMIPFGDDFVHKFHQAHEKNYGYKDTNKNLEIVNIRVRARGVPEKPSLEKKPYGGQRAQEEALLKYETIIFDSKEIHTPVYQRQRLLPGNRIPGPALVVEYTSTTVIPPFARAEVDEFGNLLLEITG